MSKIICEICGTSYPEIAAQCPICGCVKPVDTSAVVDREKKTNEGYTYVKGGRFSKKNVKKRISGVSLPSAKVDESGSEKDDDAKTNHILMTTIIVLLLAVVAVSAYIAIDMFGDVLFPDLTATEEKTEPTDTVQQNIEIHISQEPVVLEYVGQELRLQVICTPEDTSEIVRYSTDAPEVVTIDQTGKMTAVAEGEATITVTCGTAKAKCTVVCTFPEETVVLPVTEFKLNKSDVTLSVKGESAKLYDGEIPVSEVVWTSDDESVATFKDGKVVAIGPGNTKVHAEYDGKKYTCVVRCAFEDDTDSAQGEKLKISKTDVTISIGETFYLTLKDPSGKNLDVIWTSTNPGTVEISGNKITGKAVTEYSTVKTTYEGVEYSCIVRVKK